MHHVQLSDQLYEQAKERASAAGFKNVDEFVAEIVRTELTDPTENFDHLFTPRVIAHLDQIGAEIKAGAKTYTQEEVDDRLRQKAKEWRESHAS